MTSKRPDVTDAQQVVALEFVLNPKTVLIYAGPFLIGRNGRHTAGTDWTCNNTLEPRNIETGRNGFRRRISKEPSGTLITISHLVEHAKPSADGGLAGTCGIISKPHAGGDGSTVWFITSGGNAAASAIEQTVA